MSVTTEVSHIVTPNTPFVFPSNIPGDSYPPEDNMEEEPVFGADIPSVWDSISTDFSIQFTVTHSYTEASGEETVTTTYTPTILNLELINDTPPLPSIDPQFIGNDTIQIIPTIAGAFPDEKFLYIFDDLSVRELPRVNTEDWMTVKEWRQASKNEEKIFYHFNLTYDELYIDYPVTPGGELVPGDTVMVILSQFVYWSWQISLQSFQADVEESKRRMLEKAPTRIL